MNLQVGKGAVVQSIYKTFLDAGKLSGDDAARHDVVIEEIAKCDAAIAGLSGNYQ